MFRKTALIVTFVLVAYIASFAQVVPAPTNLKATLITDHNHLSVSLDWQYSETIHAKFQIYKKIGALTDTGNFVKIFTTVGKKFFDNFVQPGSKYSYYIVALLGNSVSDPSNKVEINVIPPVIEFGKISGTLLEDSTNLPIFKGSIQFIPVLKNSPCAFAVTDSFGKFTAKLLAGQYYMYFYAKGYFSEYFDNAATLLLATSVTVNANDSLVYAVGLKKYQAPVTYTLTGTVKDESGAAKYANLCLYLVNKRPLFPPGHQQFSTRTDSLGNFKFSGLLANDTLVIYVTPQDKSLLVQYYNQKATFIAADKIAVTGNVTGINVVLQPKPVYANGVSGFVKDSAGTLALKGFVYAYKKTTTGYLFTKHGIPTDTVTGAYSFTNLEPGQYILLGASRGYKSTYFKYDGTPTMDWRQADSVVIAASGVVSGINFNLRPIYHHLPGNFTTPIVYGNIKEKAGDVLDYALTYIVDNNNEVVANAISDLDGSYLIDGLQNGTYTLVTNAINYQENSIANINIDDINSGNQVDVVLTPFGTTSVGNQTQVISDYTLSQNFPNPFNPSTKIAYTVPKDGFVTISVFNAIGQKVATLINDNIKAGSYEISFDGSKLTSGIYLYSIKSANVTITKKMILIK